MKAEDIAGLLETLSPIRFACDWDNVGMHVGHKDNEINKILVTVDIDDEAVSAAVEMKADMIVSHHPMIFRNIKQINDDDLVGRRIMHLIENGINAYCMHTNYDSVGGMAEAAAARMGMTDCVVMETVCDGEGIGRTGELPKALSVGELCRLVKERFGLERVVLFGNEQEIVKKISICPGSGKDYIELARKQGAKAIITGDVSYHYGIDAAASGINVIDAGHYGIEHIFIDEISKFLTENAQDIDVVRMPVNNPQKYI